MENVLLDHRSSGTTFELPKVSVGRCGRRSLGARPATPRGAYERSLPTWWAYREQHKAGGAWSSAPVFPCARPPPIYSSPSLPLPASDQPPLLPLPPTATKYATFPCISAPPPPQSWSAVVMDAAATNTTVPVAAPAPRQRVDRRRRPARPPPSSTTELTKAQKKKKPLERATPLPPAPAVNEALDDLEQEVARNFVQDLLHALAPPPSSLPLPRFSLVAKVSPAPAARVVPLAAPSCNVEAATADAIRGLLRL